VIEQTNTLLGKTLVEGAEQPTVRTEQGALENPWVVANEEAYSMVPVGAHYRVGTDPTVRIKRGQGE
jgi:hypothetical protein